MSTPSALQPDPLSDEDQDRVLAGINDLLRETGHPDAVMARLGEWWSLMPHAELGGRTVARAWLAGDEGSVRELILQMYAASEAAAVALVRDPARMAELRSRLDP